MPRKLFIEEATASHNLLGAILGQLGGRPEDKREEEVKVFVKLFDPKLDLIEEMERVKNIFPNTKITVHRDARRELWRANKKKK